MPEQKTPLSNLLSKLRKRLQSQPRTDEEVEELRRRFVLGRRDITEAPEEVKEEKKELKKIEFIPNR